FSVASRVSRRLVSDRDSDAGRPGARACASAMLPGATSTRTMPRARLNARPSAFDGMGVLSLGSSYRPWPSLTPSGGDYAGHFRPIGSGRRLGYFEGRGCTLTMIVSIRSSPGYAAITVT